mgnify:CR=1 FL=1
MLEKMAFIFLTIRKNVFQWFAISLFFTVIYYMVLMLSLILRFGNLPNYVNEFNWVENVKTIINSTPSLLDTVMIVKDEWVFEIGYMNYDGNYEIAAFGRNITDEHNVKGAIDFNNLTGFVNEPRIIGVEFKKSFF